MKYKAELQSPPILFKMAVRPQTHYVCDMNSGGHRGSGCVLMFSVLFFYLNKNQIFFWVCVVIDFR